MSDILGPPTEGVGTPPEPERFADIERPRDDHAYWAKVCICGLDEQERTGHYPEHEDWCDVPSPMDED